MNALEGDKLSTRCCNKISLEFGRCLQSQSLFCTGIVGDVLSWKVWRPLSKLTFAVYLVHPLLVFSYWNSVKTGLHVTEFYMVTIVEFYLGPSVCEWRQSKKKNPAKLLGTHWTNPPPPPLQS